MGTTGASAPVGVAKGYLAGGNLTVGSTDIAVNTLATLSFSTQTYSNTGKAWAAAVATAAGVTSTSKGYTLGGVGALTKVVGMPYATEISALIAASMSSSRSEVSGMGSSAVKGYAAGGISLSRLLTGLNYSVETLTEVTGVLSKTHCQAAGLQSTLGGCGYLVGAGSSAYSFADKLTYATETCTDGGVGVTSYLNYTVGLDGISTGYSVGGQDYARGTVSKTVVALVYATDVQFTSTATLATAKSNITGVQSALGKGYLVGGCLSASALTNVIECLDYATVTCSVLSATLPAPADDMVGLTKP